MRVEAPRRNPDGVLRFARGIGAYHSLQPCIV